MNLRPICSFVGHDSFTQFIVVRFDSWCRGGVMNIEKRKKNGSYKPRTKGTKGNLGNKQRKEKIFELYIQKEKIFELYVKQTIIFKLYLPLPQHSTPHSLTPSLCPTYTMIPLLRLSTPQENLSYKHNDSLSPSTFSPNFYEAFVLWTILSERGIVGTVFKTCILEAFKSVTEKSLRNTN